MEFLGGSVINERLYVGLKIIKICPTPPAFEYLQARIVVAYTPHELPCWLVVLLRDSIFVYYTIQNLCFFSFFSLPILVPRLHLFCNLFCKRMTVS